MNCLFGFIVFTSNILGSFNDPFEFAGNYGEEVNPIREYVFEQVVSKEALASNLTDIHIIQLLNDNSISAEEIDQYRQQLTAQAIQEDLQHGPTLSELVSTDLIQQLIEKQKELQANGFSQEELASILYFINRYGEQKVFSFFRHSPADLLSLDKTLRDKATREGKIFDLPILSSTEPVRGGHSSELKSHLLQALFTPSTLRVVKPQEKLKAIIEQLDPLFLKQYLGQDANTEDLGIFTTPSGQAFFYWLYQALNLHLISQNEEMISQINKAKQIFADNLGNPTVRAQTFRDRLISSDAWVLFTQESDALVPSLLTEDGLFHSVASQNPADGTFVFLRNDSWEPEYQIVEIDDYEGYARGRLNVILAIKKDTNEKFLLASCHGNSTRAEDGRLQIAKIIEKYHQLNKMPENQGLQLIIGIDANTKSEEDVKRLREHLDTLGLIGTSVGPTTIKKRMVTTQHSKAGRFAIDEEDYVIVLKPENGGVYQMTHFTVGFQEEKADPTISLPNVDNPSDHYPVGTTLSR